MKRNRTLKSSVPAPASHRTKRTKFFWFFLFTKRTSFLPLLLLPALAQNPQAAVPVSTLDAGLSKLLQSSGSSFSARYNKLAPAVDNSYDLNTILHTVVGLKWATLPAAQQQQLLSAFRAYTIASYVSNFAGGNGTQIKMLPTQRAVGSDVVVETQVVPASGMPTELDYLVRQGANGWRIVDVLEEGTISQSAVTRSDFRSLITDGDASKLISTLQQKTAALSGGAALQ